MADLFAVLQRPFAGYPLGVHLLTCAGLTLACWAFALALTPDRDTTDEP